MSKNLAKVYLGFEDELINEENCTDVNYKTNKIGGIPNIPQFPGIELQSKCNICGLQRPMVLQCYAPLSSSTYHRTLYIFACINPACWNNSNSWSCFRVQHLDEDYLKKLQVTKDKSETKVTSQDPWCSGAGDWGDGEPTQSFSSNSHSALTEPNHIQSDSEDESMDLDLTLKSLSLNNELYGVSAEIENEDSSEVITDAIETTQNNLIDLLYQVPELPGDIKVCENVQFECKYISVEEEYIQGDDNCDHVKKLLQQYEIEHADSNSSLQKKSEKNKSIRTHSVDNELYEKTLPKHGDEIFHIFLTRIQANPLQIIRYSYDGMPLAMCPLPSNIKTTKCIHCGGETCFELQILPTIIPSLKMQRTTQSLLEFGTALIYSCKESCWQDNISTVKSEIVVVQKEPL